MQISHLLELLKDGVAWTSIRADEVCDIPMIDFIRSDTKFDDDTIYIGSFPKVEAFLSRLADQEPMLIICTQCQSSDAPSATCRTGNLIGVHYDEIEVYRILIQDLRQQYVAVQVQPAEQGLEALFSDLLNGNINSQLIWESRSQILRSKYDSSLLHPALYHVLYIDIPSEINQSAADIEALVRTLSPQLPFWNLAKWNGKIVGLFLEKDLKLPQPSEVAPLVNFLNTHGLYAAVVGLSVRYYRIRTLLQMAIQGIRVGKRLYAKDGTRLFYPNNDFNCYMMIDLFRRAFRSINKHDDVGYYINFPIMALIRYDNRYQTNLRAVLYNYIMTNCSITQTAELLGLHKNTVMNKLRKIESIVQCDLSDPNLQFELRFSFKVLHYFELCAELPAGSNVSDIPGDAIIVV